MWGTRLQNNDFNAVKNLHPEMCARRFITWASAQASRGAAYTWGASDDVVDAADNANVEYLINLQQAPAWATTTGQTGNAPIKDADLPYAYDWIQAVANRYKTKKRVYEIWNEPDHNSWTAAQIKTLLVNAYQRIKLADPDALVAGICISIGPTANNRASVTNVWNTLVSDAAVRNAMDICSIHVYCKGKPAPMPEIGSVTSGPIPQESLDTMAWFQARNFNKPVWVTEFGYPTVKPELNNHIDEENQARYLVRQAIHFVAAGIQRVYQFQMFGYNTDVEAGGMGLFRPVYPTGTAKPSRDAWRTLATVLDKTTTSITRISSPTGTWHYAFEKSGGTRGRVLWTQSGTQNFTLNNLTPTVRRTFRDGASAVLNTPNGSLTITANTDPVYVETIQSSARGRPIISEATMKTSIGTLFRGATMNIRPMDMPWPTTATAWDTVKGYKCNVVRLWVDTGEAGLTVEQQMTSIDTAIDLAEARNMYVLLGNGGPPGTYNEANVSAFWTVCAPRYKNRLHVFYELANEPVRNPPGFWWGDAAQWGTDDLTKLKNVYVIARTAAPNTPMVLFSTANLYPDPASWRTVVQSFEALVPGGVDWTKAAVGYHHYEGTDLFGGTRGLDGIDTFRGWYPVIMTETNHWNVPAMWNVLRNYEERKTISWINLAGKSATSCSTNLAAVMNDLTASGYTWPAE